MFEATIQSRERVRGLRDVLQVEEVRVQGGHSGRELAVVNLDVKSPWRMWSFLKKSGVAVHLKSEACMGSVVRYLYIMEFQYVDFAMSNPLDFSP